MAKLFDKLFSFSVIRTIIFFIIGGVVALIILAIAGLVTWLFEGNLEVYKLSFNIIAYIYLGILAILVLLFAIKFILGIFGIGVMAISKIKNFSIKHKEKKMLRKKDKERKKLKEMNEDELFDYMFSNSEYTIHIFTGDENTANLIENLLLTEDGKYTWNKIDPIDKNFNGDEAEWWGTSNIQWLEKIFADSIPHIDLGTKKGAPGRMIETISKLFPNLVLGFAWNNFTSGNCYATVMKNGEVLNQEQFDMGNYFDDDKNLSDEEIEENYIKLFNDEGRSIYDFTAKYIQEHPEELEALKRENDGQINE